jgi:hypothetical protein
MALSIVGAGLGRTGTLSLKVALERLGFGPCYHMTEVFSHPQHVALWSDALGGRFAWDELFAGYRAAIDWPACHFWRELADHAPGAKVILTLRSPESWYASIRETIFEVLRAEPPPAPEMQAWHRMVKELIAERTFGSDFPDRERAIAVYERHNDAVKRALPPERLLVYEVAQGWDPLCRFLGAPVPAEPFPRVNSKDEFRARAGLGT